MAVTIDRLEAALDRLALEIEAFGSEGEVLVPLYQFLENELAAARASATTMDSVRARLTEQRNRRAGRSSSVQPA